MSDYALQTAWDFKGTTAKKHEEVMAAKRKELQDDPGLARRKMEDYDRWYREERRPPWQERVFNKILGLRHSQKKAGQPMVAETRGDSIRSDAAPETPHTRRLSGSTLG